MSEKGTVIEVKNNGKTAVISFDRTVACEGCKRCMAGFSSSQMIMEARNDIGAVKGSMVFIELPERGFLTAAVITYLIPLMLMMAGFFGGGYLSRFADVNSELFSFALGTALLLVSFLVIRLNERRIKSLPIFMPYISKIAS